MDGMATAYYSQQDISLLLGRDRHMVRVWRSRFGDFPEPDVEIGTVNKIPGWKPERIDEIVAWAAAHGFAVQATGTKPGGKTR